MTTRTAHRLTLAQADEIRNRHSRGESIYSLGAAFGVAPQTVARTVAYEIHRPIDRRVVPVLLTRRDYAALALRAEEHGEGPRETAAVLLSRALAAP